MSELPNKVVPRDGRYFYAEAPDVQVSDADTLGSLVDVLHEDLVEALNAWERWIEEKRRHDPDWPGYGFASKRINELRTKHLGAK